MRLERPCRDTWETREARRQDTKATIGIRRDEACIPRIPGRDTWDSRETVISGKQGMPGRLGVPGRV